MSCRQRFPPKCVAPTPSRSASRAYGRNALAFLRGVRRANRLCTLSGPHFPNALWRKPQPSDSGTSGLEGTKTLGRRLSLRLLRPPLHRLVLRRPPFADAHSDPPIACFVLLRRTRIQSVPPSLLPRAVVSPSKQSVTGGKAPPRHCFCHRMPRSAHFAIPCPEKRGFPGTVAFTSPLCPEKSGFLGTVGFEVLLPSQR